MARKGPLEAADIDREQVLDDVVGPVPVERVLQERAKLDGISARTAPAPRLSAPTPAAPTAAARAAAPNSDILQLAIFQKWLD